MSRLVYTKKCTKKKCIYNKCFNNITNYLDKHFQLLVLHFDITSLAF